MCTGRYSLMKVETIVSAVLSSIGYASGQPVRSSDYGQYVFISRVRCVTFCDEIYCYLVKWSIGNLHHLKRVILNFGFFPADIVYNLLCTSRCLYSFPSNNIDA